MSGSWGWVLIEKGHESTPWCDENIINLDLGGICLGVYPCKNWDKPFTCMCIMYSLYIFWPSPRRIYLLKQGGHNKDFLSLLLIDVTKELLKMYFCENEVEPRGSEWVVIMK